MKWSTLGNHGMAVTLLLCSCCISAKAQSRSVELTSPDRQIAVRFSIRQAKNSTGSDGQLIYTVSYRGKVLLDPSALALELEGQPILGEKVHIAGSTPGEGIDDYTMFTGKTGTVHDAYNSLRVRAAESGSLGRSFVIEARAYNNAFAFRYLVPQQPALKDYRLHQEDTEFRLSSDAISWALALPNYQSSYEAEYLRLALSALSNQGGVPSHFLIGLPMLMHIPGQAWLALEEADTEGNSAMYVTNPSGNWEGHWLISKLSPQIDHPEIAVSSSLPHHSAWRVVSIGDTPGALMESNILEDLNPPNAIPDTSWIHPGKASWDWWTGDIGPDGKPAYTTKNMEYYVDFAAKSGFPYMMLDAGWSGKDITKMRGNVDVPELARYAARKHVKIWIWAFSKSVAAQMKQAFPLYEKWGVAGVKIDFVDRNDQQGIQFYYDVAREAAKDHLMIDFHGTTSPWGIDRTYPNLLNYEAVLGMENSKAGRRDGPVDRTVFPFTRMLAGPLDYTPGAFGNVTQNNFIARSVNPMSMGTRAQQLALYVLFQAPLQMVSDAPQAYAGQPSFQFIREVPVAWDATKVLDGEPGKYVTIARRHGRTWYLGSITNWTPRTLSVPLDFLGTGTYTAEIYEDGPDAATNAKNVTIRKQSVNKGEGLTLHLAPGGGCAIRFVPD